MPSLDPLSMTTAAVEKVAADKGAASDKAIRGSPKERKNALLPLPGKRRGSSGPIAQGSLTASGRRRAAQPSPGGDGQAARRGLVRLLLGRGGLGTLNENVKCKG